MYTPDEVGKEMLNNCCAPFPMFMPHMNEHKSKCASPVDVKSKLNKCDLIYIASMHSAIKTASENYDTECPNDKGLSIWDGYRWQTVLEYSKELQNKANALITKANNLIKLEELIKQDLEKR